MEEILQRQADVNVLRPAGSRKYHGWANTRETKMRRITDCENNA